QTLQGYVIEYGGLDDINPTVSSLNASITTEDTTGPSTPGKPTADSPTSDNTPEVSWDASNDDGGTGLADPAYTLEWSDSATFAGGADGSLTVNSTTASPNSGLADGTWYFRVIAKDNADNTTTSSISDTVLI